MNMLVQRTQNMAIPHKGNKTTKSDVPTPHEHSLPAKTARCKVAQAESQGKTGRNVGQKNAKAGAAPQQLLAIDVAALLMEYISLGAVFVDTAGTVGYLNPAAEGILGISHEEAVGVAIDTLPQLLPLCKALGENMHGQLTEISLPGRIVLANTRNLGLPGGTSLGTLVEIRDITEEKRERRQREEFVAMMTHDLKSPLTVLLGYAQSLGLTLDYTNDRAVHEPIEEIERSGFKILSMIDDILDAYRLEMGMLQSNKDYCDVHAVVEGCCRDWQREAADQGVMFACSIDPSIPVAVVDGKQLGRVFANLVANAVKFTPRDGRVNVSVAMEGSTLCFTVKDSGIGISPKEIPRIFNKYYRSDRAVGFKGTGLGLTIAKAMVEAHNGSISVESTEGVGSVFTVHIPLPAE